MKAGSVPFTSIQNWMYRTEHDNMMQAVITAEGFIYPDNTHPGVLGLGGIYFACSVPHVLGYAADKTQSRPRHFFMCPMPDPVVVWESHLHRETGPINHDTLARNVLSGNHSGDEFVKAGACGELFTPDALILVRVQ